MNVSCGLRSAHKLFRACVLPLLVRISFCFGLLSRSCRIIGCLFVFRSNAIEIHNINISLQRNKVCSLLCSLIVIVFYPEIKDLFFFLFLFDSLHYETVVHNHELCINSVMMMVDDSLVRHQLSYSHRFDQLNSNFNNIEFIWGIFILSLVFCFIYCNETIHPGLPLQIASWQFLLEINEPRCL